MVLPLVHAKISGVHCGEGSRFRVSEIVMFTLLSSRVALNVYVDILLVNFARKRSSPFSMFRHVIWSLLEHSLPCVGYLAIMYMVFVRQLKPPLDDEEQ
jgi:hypothetical protein